MSRFVGQRVYIAGHTGLVGSALVRRWSGSAAVRLLRVTRAELDLTNGPAVAEWLSSNRPDTVVIAAGLVGGILANSRYPADFIYENVMIEANLIHGSWKAGVKRLVNFGSSCMYPKDCPQPMTPTMLMTGKLEPTSEPYALAKWAGLSLCASYNRQHGTRFITAIPATVYGPGDSFDPEHAHVLSALMRKFHEAVDQGVREVTLWGSGNARREFLYVEDLAEACEVLLEASEESAPINVGSGVSLTIREMAQLVADVVGFRGEVRWDTTRPDGAPAKTLDSTAIRRMGWVPRTDLQQGLRHTYRWFVDHMKPQLMEHSEHKL